MAEMFNNLNNENKNVVAIPSMYRNTLFVCGIVFLMFTIIACVIKGNEWVFGAIFCAVLGLSGTGCAFFWTMWRIRFDENGFEYRNYFGIKKRYEFKDLELWEHPKGTRWKFLKSGKRVVTFSYVNSNCDELIDEYLKNKKGKE